RMPRSLILEPTRELAAQVADSFDVYGKYNKLTKALLIGGVAFAEQEAKLTRGVDVLIATPGRLLDHFGRGRILMADIKILVIDEADRMLDMGFIPDVEKIFNLLPKTRQTLMFSATMPPEIRRLADTYLNNPLQIAVTPPASTSKNIIQGVIHVRGHHKEKRAALRAIIRREDVKNALIFCNRKRDVTIVSNSLQRHGFNVASLHGDMVQSLRMETLEKFKNDEITLLVASDVAARGLDIINMSHVFNYDVPTSADDYVHRVGRTGRAGREGHAFTLAMPEDRKYIAAIEKLTGNKIAIIALEGISDTTPQAEPADDQERPRRGRRDERSRHGPRKPQARSSEPARQSTEPARQSTEPARQSTEPAKKAVKKDSDPRRGRRPDRRADDDDIRVVGLGDHVPNFLKR
ncbi:MAG: DEAD/DEAH box helicase, partial [Alphaproteobacteria bacterium]|nr:DEAD/DEAH box helicase [Alphaproteobacteria bacterium]